MQELTVASVEKKMPKKEGGTPFYVVKGMDGEEMTTFDAAILDCGSGTKLNVAVIVKGKYTNIDSWVVLEKATPQTAAAAAATGAESDNQKRLSIERQSSAATLLQYAATVQAAGGGVGANEQAAVNKAIAWLSSRFDETPQTSEQEWAKLQSAGTPKDMGALLTWCQEQGISRAKFMEIGEIDEEGMKKVNIEEAYLVVKDYLHEHKGG